MARKFASAKIAIAVCDRCGFQYKLKKLKSEVIRHKETNLKVCPDCFDLDHPQNNLGDVRVEDPQALRNPRPDTSFSFAGSATSSRAVYWGWSPVGGEGGEDTNNPLVGDTKIGEVTITT
jgi:hypothetical protein